MKQGISDKAVLSGAWERFRKYFCWAVREELAPKSRFNTISMGKGDPNKLRGTMFSSAFFLHPCWEGTQEEAPWILGQLCKVLKEISKRWKTMSGKKKSRSLKIWPNQSSL